MGETPPSGTPTVKSAARTVAILEYLAGRVTRPARVRDVAGAIGAPKSSTYAVLQTLARKRWVHVDPTGNLYTLGIRALLAGTSYLDADPKVRVIRPILTAVVERIDETVHLGRLDGDQIVYLATVESRQYLRPFSRVGRRIPATVTGLGQALLAERIDAPEFSLPRELPALTPHSITNPSAMLESLRATRDRGYAIDHEEAIVGVTCFAFTLRYDEPPRDAISCSVPNARLAEGREEQILRALREARAQIETTVGSSTL